MVPSGSCQIFSRLGAMLGIGDDHVGGQAMRERADLAGGAARRWLSGQRERAVARFGNLAGQQVQIVDEIVGPDAARVLIEAHGPQAHDLGVWLGVELGQGFDAIERHTGFIGRPLQRSRPRRRRRTDRS